MTEQIRDCRKAANTEYDAIIVGGGIYGVTLALEAGRRGLKTLLLEKGDFGEYTSFNSLKIVHGGLRYLQSLDLPRFKESITERSWFLRHFPKRVEPLPCLMPLYGRGMKRPAVFRIALWLNHLLSLERNKGLDANRVLPMGGIASIDETKKIFPLVNTKGLQGSALWYDACMPDSQLLIMDLLQYACETGTTALNYCPVTSITTGGGGGVKGVVATDRATGEDIGFRATTVINSCGPWSPETISGLLGQEEALYRPSLAWNVSFNRPSLSDHALAVQGPASGSRILFVTPWKGRIFVGCGHEPWLRNIEKPMPNEQQMNTFIDEVNDAVPGLKLSLSDVHRVFAGFLPTVEKGSNVLTKREVIIDHGAKGGPSGLYSIGGIKFTTARLVAEKIWGMVGGKNPAFLSKPAPMPVVRQSFYQSGPMTTEAIAKLRAEDPTIVHLDDLLLRRSTLYEDADNNEMQRVAAALGLEEPEMAEEIARCTPKLQPLALEQK
jgi:glycerol-3-phosphate dehydrogenase